MKFIYYSDWEQLPESASALFEQAENDNIFYSLSWFKCLTTNGLDEGQTQVLACVENGDQILAILPLIKSTGNSWNSLSHRYTPRYSLLLSDEAQGQVLACLAEGLSQFPLKGLLLEPVASDDINLKGLQQALETAGFHCDYLFRHYNWIHRVQGQTYTEYMAERPASLRNTIARKRRKLEREQDYEIRLFTGDDVPAAMPDYYAVYKASWKANEQYTGLVDDMVGRFSRQSWTRLAVMYIKGKPAAAQLWLVCHGKASIFRLAYDEAWKPYSLGSILMAYLMEYVIDTDEVEKIDFLTGNDAYKQDWMTERQECFALSCVRSEKQLGIYDRVIDFLKRIL